MATTASLPPLPSAGQGQSDDAPEQSTPLAAMPDQSAKGGSPVNDAAQNIMRQIMEQRRLNETLAAQYPPAAKALRKANDSLKEAMLQIVREVQQAPGSNPSSPVGLG